MKNGKSTIIKSDLFIVHELFVHVSNDSLLVVLAFCPSCACIVDASVDWRL